jgi:hypothetical protein
MVLITTLIALLVMIVFLSGCSAQPSNALLGKWQEIDETSNTFEFFKDGTVSVTTKEQNYPLLLPARIVNTAGNYKFVDKDKIKMDFPSASVVCKISFSDGVLTMTLSDGEFSKFRRVK